VCPGCTRVNRELGLGARNQSCYGGFEIDDITSYGQAPNITADERGAFVFGSGGACSTVRLGDNPDKIPFEEPDVRYERIAG
jgi:hypothetical protein